MFSKRFLVFVLSMMVCLFSWGQNNGHHIVADGTSNNSYVPVYGNYLDQYQRCQSLYPAALLSELQGATITNLVYYLSTSCSQMWTSTFQIKMGVVSDTALHGFVDTDSLTMVYTGQLDATGATMTIELDAPFFYSGGNLLVEFVTLDCGNYVRASFYGESYTYASWQGKGSSPSSISGQSRGFLPKVDFFAANVSCVMPEGFQLVGVYPDAVHLAWTADTTALGYLVVCGDDTLRVTGGACSVEGLQPNTEYTCSLMALCANGDTSEAASLSLLTPCAPFVVGETVSFVEDFEAGISACWQNNHLSGPGNRLWITDTRYSHSGSYAACLPDQSSLTRTMLVSQPIVVPEANAYQLSFWVYRQSSVPESYQSRTEEGIRVWVNTQPDTIGASSLVYHHRNLDLGSVAGFYLYEAPLSMADTIYLIFEGISMYSGAQYLDDVVVEKIPSCAKPYNLGASYVLSSKVKFSWADVYYNSMWNLRYRVQGEENWIEDTAILTAKTYELTGLQPQTSYEIQVRSRCSAQDVSRWSNSLFVTTSCIEIAEEDLPYVEDFESLESSVSAPIDPCWFKFTNASTNYPYPTVQAAISGTRGLLFYAFHPETVDDRSIYSYAVLPPISDSIDIRNLSLDFNLKRYDATSNNYTSRMQVGVMTDPHNISTFRAVRDADIYAEAPNSVVSVTTSFSSYTGSGAYIALRCPEPALYGGTMCHNFAYVDDVVLYYTPTCFPPNDVRVAELGANAATLAWSNGGVRTDLRYRPDFDSSWTLVDSLTETTATIRELESHTHYYFQLRSHCLAEDSLADDVSSWSASYEFTTRYGLPFEESFAADTLPNEWSTLSGRAFIAVQPHPESGVWVHSTALGHSVKSNIYTSYCHWLVSPTIDMGTDSNVILTFKLAVTDFNSASHPGPGEPDADDQFRVLVSTDDGTSWQAANAASWGTGSSYDHNLSDLTEQFSTVAVPLMGYANQNVTLAFYTGSIAGTSDFDVHVADVSLSAPSPCDRPTLAMVDAVTFHSAMLHWNSSALVQLRYRPYGTSEWTEIDSLVAGNTFLLDGLEEQMQYAVQARSVCDSFSRSTWVDFQQFTTLCAPEGLPYLVDFDQGIAECWQIASALYQPDTAISLQPTVTGWTTSQRVFADNHLMLNIYGTSCHYWAVSPVLHIERPAQVSFDAALTAFGSTSRPSSLGADDKFMVLVTGDDGLTWTPLLVCDNGDSLRLSAISATGSHFNLPITGFQNADVRVAFYAESSVINADNDLHISNILFSRQIIPADTVHFQLAQASLSGYPVSQGSYCFSGQDSVIAAVVTVPVLSGFYRWEQLLPNAPSLRLSGADVDVSLLSGSAQVTSTPEGFRCEAWLIDLDTLCYHITFHYTIPPVEVSLAADTGRGTIALSGTCRMGDSITLTALPLQGTCFRFAGWSDGDSLNPRRVFLLSDTSFEATFVSVLVYDVDTVGEACNSYVWFDSLYTLSGSYTYQSQPLNGCDSVATLDLTIHYDSFDTIVDAVCDSLYWLLADTTIFQSGSYDFHLTNGFGCDSSVTLQLTVNSSVIDSVAIEISNAELPYTYNNIVLDTFGVYPFHLSTVEGCDSLVVLSLRHLLQINNSTNQHSNMVTVSPNPTQGRLAVLHPQFEYCELYDLSGRKLLYSRESEIDLSQLPAAVYTLRIVTSQGTYLRKVVKLER